MQKIIIVNICILLISCTYLPDTQGKENEIVVITSPEDRVLVEQQVLGLFVRTINTPEPEPEFSLVFKNPWELENVSKYGNLFIVSLDFPQDSTGDLLMQRIISQHKQKKPLFVLGELYAKKQIVCVLHTLDALSMEIEIDLNKEWILTEFRNNLSERLELNIYKHGKNILLSEKVLDMFGYTIDLQQDYKIIKSDSLKPFIWLGRGYPYRWITLHKSKKNKFTNTVSAWKELTKIYSVTLKNIQVGKDYRSTEIIDYRNTKRRIMRGVYEHDQSATGGPFFVYIFETETINEVILVSGFVNYPGHEKIILLKQLEVIANTLHQGEI